MSSPSGNEVASTLQLLGAGGFGAIIGWYVYFINRYRTEAVQFGDLVTVIGIIGGGTVLTLFHAGTDLFGAYGVGLFAGFFGYFLVLTYLVKRSANFDADWFLDGRRKKLNPDYYIPDGTRPSVTAMALNPGSTGNGQGGTGGGQRDHVG